MAQDVIDSAIQHRTVVVCCFPRERAPARAPPPRCSSPGSLAHDHSTGAPRGKPSAKAETPVRTSLLYPFEVDRIRIVRWVRAAVPPDNDRISSWLAGSTPWALSMGPPGWDLAVRLTWFVFTVPTWEDKVGGTEAGGVGEER